MFPTLFTVGTFSLHSWGVLLMIGFLFGAWRAARIAPRYGIAPEDLWDASLFGLLGGIVGARLAFVAQNLSDYVANPLSALALWNGGMTSFGGLIGGVAVGLWVMHSRGRSLIQAADLVAPSLALGYFWGRIGCYLNGCCYGGACPPPLGVHFPNIANAPGTVHPTQLYSAAAGLAIFFILVAVERRRQFAGQIIALFAILYAVYRFVVEYFREGATAGLSGIGSLTTGQIACLIIAALATLYYVARAGSPRTEQDFAPTTPRDIPQPSA